MLKATVEFANGTAITDKFSDKDDFNLWVKNAIADFGNIVYIKILEGAVMGNFQKLIKFKDKHGKWHRYFATYRDFRIIPE